MKIFYITNARMPTEKAHGFQIAKTCEALACAGADVELIVPRRKNTLTDDVFTHYDVKKNFTVRYIRALDLQWLPIPRCNYYLTAIFFLLRTMFLYVRGDTVVYTRSPEIAWWFKRKHPCVYEAHTWPNSGAWLLKKFLKNVTLVVANSNGTAAVLKKNISEPIVVARNGVDLTLFENLPSQRELRNEFGLPLDQHIVLYTGRFDTWKGIDVIFDIAKKYPKTNSPLFVISGGIKKEEDACRVKINNMKIPNIVIVPAQFGRMLPRLIGVADVLLLPNVPVHKESEFHTSPIKSFSYMASGKPIIASDMPSIREVLNEQNAVLVMPGAADAFKKAIDDVRKGGLLVEGRAKQALATVNEFTWHRRVAIILREITQRTQLK